MSSAFYGSGLDQTIFGYEVGWKKKDGRKKTQSRYGRDRVHLQNEKEKKETRN